MKFNRILLFGYFVLHLESTTDCAYGKIYRTLLVENIKPSATRFANVEPFVLFNTDVLSDQERWDMCNEASQIVNEEGGCISISKRSKIDLLRPYRVDMVPSDSNPKIMKAFKCPTKSPIYLQSISGTKQNSAALLVSIIVSRRDVQLRSPPINGMCYVKKLVREIRPVERSQMWLSNQVSLRRGAGWFDTNRLSDVQRIEMCRRAQMDILVADRNVEFVEKTRADVKRLYVVQSEKNPLLYSVVEAFGCPTIPVIYLEVLDVEDNGAMVYWVRVITETVSAAVPNSVTGLQYRYHLEIILCITTSTVLKSDNLIDMPEEQRLSVCREAFQEIHQTEGRNVEFLENSRPGNSEYYRILFNEEGKREDGVLAFKCPTKLPIFLAISERQQVRIFMEETEFVFPQLGIVGYRFEIVTDVAEVASSAELRAEKSSGIIRHTSVVGPDRNFPEQCRRLCEQIVSFAQRHTKFDVKFFTESEIGPSRYYILETVSRSPAIANESAERGPIAVKAFSCPTYPEIYLNVRAVAGTGNIVWIYARETRRAPALKILRFETAGIFMTVTAVSDPGPRIKSVRMSDVNTDLLEEEQRRRLCRSARMHTASELSVEYLEDTATKKLQLYALERESEDGRILRSCVQAFECPTDPPIYLHIRDQDGGHIVWIIEKIAPPPPHEETLPPLEFLCFTVKLVKDVIEAKSIAVDIQEDISSRLDYMTLDSNILPAQYRRRLCEKAAQIVSAEEKVDVSSDGEPEPSTFYRVVEFRKVNYYEPPVKVFQCSTDPPLYLQLMKESGIQSFSVVVLVRKSNLIDVRNEFQYMVKFVENIAEVASATSYEFGSIDSSAVDISLFTEKQRLRMCEEALKQLLPADESILESMIEDTAPPKFYSLGLRSRDRNLESHTVRAFQCLTTALEVYLELHYWQSQGFIAWIIAKKMEVARLTTEFQEPSRQRLKPTWEPIRKPPRQPPKPTGEPFEELPRQFIKPTWESVTRELQRQSPKPSREPFEEPPRQPLKPSRKPLKEPPRQFLEPTWESIVREPAPSSETIREPARPSRKSTTVTAPSSATRQARNDADDGTGSDQEIKRYKVKFVEDIYPASSHETNSTLSSPRAQLMVNTDVQYSEDQRVQMCTRAVQVTVPDQNVRLFKGLTGRSRFFNVDEGFEVDNIPEIKRVRAFECPTEPPLFLEVRRRKYKGTTVMVIVKEFKPIKYSLSLSLKSVDSIKRATIANSNISRHSRSSSSIEDKRPNITNEFSASKLLQICKRGWKMVSDRELQLSVKDLVNEVSQEYIIDSDSRYSEKVNAFKCPTKPPIYLEIHRRIPGEYTVLIINEQHEANLVLTPFSKRKNIKYRIRSVANISAVPPHRVKKIYELIPHLEEANLDDVFDELDRTVICRDAMKMIPDVRFEFLRNGIRDITRTYILNGELDNQEFVKAFKCPTAPDLHIQMEENEGGSGYTAWMIMATGEQPEIGVTRRDRRARERGFHSFESSVQKTTEENQSSSSGYDSDRSVTRDEDELITSCSRVREPRNRAKENAPASTSYELRRASREARGSDNYPPPELQIVEKIMNADSRRISIEDPSDLPPPEPVIYNSRQRDGMCEEGRSVIPGQEFIGRLENRDPKEHELYVIYYRSRGVLQEDIISAFLCPYEPPFIIQTYDKTVRRRVTRVIVTQEMLPAGGLIFQSN